MNYQEGWEGSLVSNAWFSLLPSSLYLGVVFISLELCQVIVSSNPDFPSCYSLFANLLLIPESPPRISQNAVVPDSLAVPHLKKLNRTNSSTQMYTAKRNEHLGLQKNLYKNVHSSLIHNILKSEMTHMSIH